MDSMKLFWGLVLLSFGAVLLGVNQGWLASSIWVSIFALWPIILIAIGLKLLVKNEKLLSGFTIGLVLLATVFVVLTYDGGSNDRLFGDWNTWGSSLNNKVYSETLSGDFDAKAVKKVNVTVSTGAITLLVKELPDNTKADTLYEIKTADMGKIDVTKNVKGDTLTLDIKETQTGMHFVRPVTNRRLELYLSKSVILDLNVDSGASKVALDYSKLKVQGSDINIGASSGDIFLGDMVARQTLLLNAGASSLTFHVPVTLGVDATFDGGVSTITSEPALDITKSENNYKSTNFDTKVSQIVITGNTGVSSIKFQSK